MNTPPPPPPRPSRPAGPLLRRFLFPLVAGACLAPFSQARAEKLEITIDQVMPTENQDAGEAGGGQSDVFVRLTVTPQDGASLVAESPVIQNTSPFTKALQGFTFPVFTVPPRPATITWEVRDSDGGAASELMERRTFTISPNDDPLTSVSLSAGGSIPLSSAFGVVRARWAPDWGKVFGVVQDGENGCLDLQGVADKMTAALSGHPQVVKFGFRLSLGLVNLEHTEGLKRSEADPPAMPDFLITDRFNPASVTKTFTATALLRAMEREGVELDQSIAPYLPALWTKGPLVNGITFRQVLDHTSGFRGSASSHAAVRALIAAGVRREDKVYEYSNANYNICRVLLAMVSGYVPVASESLNEQVISGIFTGFINEELLGPLGIPAAAWQPDTASGALFYSHAPGVPLQQRKGTGFANRALSPGSAGIQLSLREISTLFTRLWTPGLYLPKSTLNIMRDLELGGRMLTEPVDGPAFVKGGSYPLAGYGAQESSCVVRFGNGLTAAVMINGGVNAYDTLILAYNSSWYHPAQEPALQRAVSARAAAVMRQLPRMSPRSLEDVMLSLYPGQDSLVSTEPLSDGLHITRNADGTGFTLAWNAATDSRVRDTLYHSPDLRRWEPEEEFPALPRGGQHRRAYPADGGGGMGYYRVGRVLVPDTESLIAVLNSTPADIPFTGRETTLSQELLDTGLTLRGINVPTRTTRTVRPPINDKPPISRETDDD